ncbi:MAG: hypothetical protein EXS69_01720 [Candidatus Zambryskibacteria bacterium]|nr:hypothetical protein [Candidatus Zambryskibacteria bacterium]
MRRFLSASLWFGGGLLLIIFSTNFVVPYLLQTSYSAVTYGESERSLNIVDAEPPVIHLATPTPLKAIYMTACVAATLSRRDSLKALVDSSELNAIVIDIKDYTGTISFPILRQDFAGQANNVSKGCVVSDLKDFIRELHEDGIYVIGRVSVFQDSFYAALFPELAVKSLSTGGVWKDHKGLSFIDVGAKPYWDYIVQISKASYALGFDELNYDYIRYPSDGNMKDVNYTWTASTSSGQATTTLSKSEMLESFFSYLYDNMKDPSKNSGQVPVISADLFGMTTTITSDMGIGQVLEKALPYFDYIAPMVYPSHYPATWNGLENPAEHPYNVIKLAMSEGKRREEILNISNGLATSTPSKLRPWLQDFSLGAIYGPDKIQAQIQATYDSGLTSWMLWSAANKYSVEALLPN